ncbi:amidase [Rhizobium brockwellii]|uniref:amidase n=1 Tax=Rhizobium brockwellii TaxID=3019932 RepID=UPI003F969E61
MGKQPILLTRGFRDRVSAQIERMNNTPEDAKFAVSRRRDQEALSEAQAWETLAAMGAPPRLPVTVSVKACYDVAGWSTHASSRVLSGSPSATEDASLVAALRRNGAVVVNQSNMTEFAFGALGLNTAFGTPRSPLDPERRRIVGGSTSGGAVSVAMGFTDIALGSDTSGSIRIPAAFAGLAGFKPSHGRYDRTGMMFLAPTFDVPGFIARDVEMLQRIDDVIIGELGIHAGRSVAGRKFLVPSDFANEGVQPDVADIFNQSVQALRAAGATVVEEPFPELSSYGPIAVEGGIIIAEAYEWHRPLLDSSAHLYDRRVGPRILLGAEVRASVYIHAIKKLRELAQAYDQRLQGYDGLLLPTIPCLPPRIEEVESDEDYNRLNRLTFRFTEIANRIDAPSVTFAPDPTRPIGLMITGRRGNDKALLEVSRAIEAVVQPNFKTFGATP